MTYTPSQDLQKAKAYQKLKLRLFLLNTILELGGLVFLLVFGLSGWLNRLIMGWSDFSFLQGLYFFVVLGLAAEVLSFPLDFYRGYLIEHRYGLSNQTFRSWLWDWIKSIAVSGILGLILAEGVYALLRNTGANWWWVSALVMIFFMVVLVQLAPVILLPIFYKVRSLDRPELREKLIQLAEKWGMKIVDVFELELSAKSKAANAALAGLGRTRRIFLGDTLLENYSDEEIEAVLAHELGHHYYAHLWKNIAVQTGFIFLGFYLADVLLRWGVQQFGFEGIWDLSAFPLLALSFSVLALVLLPLINALSRHFERQADRFAVKATGQPEAMANALEKLSDQNLADPKPHPLVEALFYSHPSIHNRLKEIREK